MPSGLIPSAMTNTTASGIVYTLEDRIAEAVGIPVANQEHFQVGLVDWVETG
jgi:hypothetical protein